MCLCQQKQTRLVGSQQFHSCFSALTKVKAKNQILDHLIDLKKKKKKNLPRCPKTQISPGRCKGRPTVPHICHTIRSTCNDEEKEQEGKDKDGHKLMLAGNMGLQNSTSTFGPKEGIKWNNLCQTVQFFRKSEWAEETFLDGKY